MLTEKEIEREFRLACVKACEKQGVPRPDVTVQAESTDDLLSLGQKMLDEMAVQGIVWMYEEAISLAAAAIAKRLSEAEKEWEMTKGVLEAALEASEEVWDEDFTRLKEQLATAQAQVAVMAGALEEAHSFIRLSNLYHQRKLGLRDSGRYVSGRDVDVAGAKAADARDNALSAAPKVVWSGKALLVGWDGSYKQLVIEKGELVLITPTDRLDKHLPGKEAKVFVLDQAEGKGEK